MSDTDPKKSQLLEHSKLLNDEFIALTKSVAEAQAKFEDLHPTVANEMSQISGQSIGAKIADLPSSLKHLNSNLEGRAVTAADSWTTALADSAIQAAESLLKLKKIPDILLQTWTDKQVASGNQAQLVAQGSVGLAAQISSIRNNETDPARQEMLIKRAQDAQANAEAIGQTQVNAANQAYKKAQYDNSFVGKSANVAKDYVTGAITDYIKGTVQNSLADMFKGSGLSGLFGGKDKPKIAASGAAAVYVENMPTTGGVASTDPLSPIGSTGTSTPSNPIGSLGLAGLGASPTSPGGIWGGASLPTASGTEAIPANMFTYSGGSASTSSQTQDPATKVADAVSTSVTDSLSSPWYTGFTDTMSTGFTGFIGGLTQTFGTFTGALGVLLGMQNGGGKTDTVSTIQKYVGLASAAVGIAGGINGMFKGASTPPPAPDTSISGYNYVSNGGGGDTSSYFGSNSSLGGLFSKYAQTHATGGHITGPGTSTSDSIPAMLSNGEYVLNAKAVAAIGKDTLDNWNFQSQTPARFATGGAVGDIKSSINSISSPAPVAPTPSELAPPAQQSVRVVLVDDHRKVKDFMTSSEGEKVMVDFVRRNSLSLKTVLK
jgi:hypothetical protein